MRQSLLALVLASSLSTAVQAQTLRERFSDLFRFGSCGEVLCISNVGGHGNHFIPAATSGNVTTLGYISNTLGAQAANLPISATTSGVTYSIVRGIPVQSTTSSGPIFGERAQTLGKGRTLMGVSVNMMSFTQLGGTDLSKVGFNFIHEDNPPSGLGNPDFETDVLHVETNMSLKLLMTAFVFTYGATDRLDLGLAIPMVRTSLSGTARANVQSSLAISPHFFGGTQASPITSAITNTDASSTGIGDIALRAKANLSPADSKTTSLGILADIRLPTGSADNFQGAGGVTARFSGIASRTYGTFTPHANAGVAIRSGDYQTNSILANAGFDKLLSPRATVAFDLLSEFQLGSNDITLPPPVVVGTRTISLTNLESKRNDFVHGSIGLKLVAPQGFTAVVNAVVPLMNTGLRPNAVLSAGIEIGF